MVIVVSPFVGLKLTIDKKRRERAAIAVCEQSGWELRYKWVANASKEEPGPAWLRWLMGDNILSSVVYIRFNGQVTDDTLVVLESLPDLEEVYVIGKGISDTGLKHCTGLHQLRVLDVSRNAVTDQGLVYLKGLTGFKGMGGLQHLNVAQTAVTAAGVAKLQEALPRCQINR